MDNHDILEDLKFGIGDGNLNYYIYNWKCPTISPSKVLKSDLDDTKIP